MMPPFPSGSNLPKIPSKESEPPKEGVLNWIGEWFSILIGIGEARVMKEDVLDEEKPIKFREIDELVLSEKPQFELPKNPSVDEYRKVFINFIVLDKAEYWEEFSTKFIKLIETYQKSKIIYKDKSVQDFNNSMEYYKNNPFDFYLALTTPGSELYVVYQYEIDFGNFDLKESFDPIFLGDERSADTQKKFFRESIGIINENIKEEFVNSVKLSISKVDLEYFEYKKVFNEYQEQFEKCRKIKNKDERDLAFRDLYKRYQIDFDTQVPEKDGPLGKAIAVIRAKEGEVFRGMFDKFYEGDDVLILALEIIEEKRNAVAKVMGIDIEGLTKELQVARPSQKTKEEFFKLQQRFWESYDTDNSLKNAIDAFEIREVALRKLLGFNCDAILDKSGRGIHRSGLERARDFVLENPRASLATVSIAVGVLVSPIVPLAVGALALGGVASRRLYMKVEPRVTKAVTEALITETNLIAYYKEKKVRQAAFNKVLLEAPTTELKAQALKELLDRKLLFREDLDFSGLNKDEFKEVKKYVEPYLKAQGIEVKDLPSFAEYRELRRDNLKILREPFVSDSTKRECIRQLFESELLFKEDLARFSPTERAGLLNGLNIVYEKLPEIKSLSETRNSLLQVLNGGIELTVEQRFEELKNLHAMGLFFQEDFGRVKKHNPELEQDFRKYIGEERIKDLKPIRGRYIKTKVALQQEHDEVRKPFLVILKDNKSSPEQKLFALKQMHMNRLCFREDLELSLIDETVKREFFEFIKRTPAERAAEFMKRTDAVKIIAGHEQVLKSKTSSFEDKLDSFVALYVEGLKPPSELKKLVADGAVVVEFNRRFLVNLSMVSNILPTRKDYYEKGYYEILSGLAEGVGKAMLKQHPGKVALVGAYAMGAGPVMTVAAGAAGLAAGVAVRRESPNELIAIPIRDTKTVAKGGIELAGEIITDFTTIETKDLQARLIEWLPSENRIKTVSTEILNKGVGTLKYGVMGGAIGGTLAGMVSSSLVSTGVQVGGVIGGAYGMSITDRTVNQIPAGGLVRAMKFSSAGALVGAVTPLMIGIFTMGLAFGGLIAMGTALSIFSFGLGLIIPLIIFGVYAGFQIAGMTGVDIEENEEDLPLRMLEQYEPEEL